MSDYAEQFLALLKADAPDPHRPRILLFGPYGSGKTTSLATLVAAGFELAVLQTEPSEVLDHLPEGKFFRHYVAPGVADWDDLENMAKDIRDLSYKTLVEKVDSKKRNYDQWFNIIRSTAKFVDDRTGRDLGNVSDWPANRVFAIDSLSGLTRMAQKLCIGLRPAIQLQEYTLIQESLGSYLESVITTTTCPFVLIAHPEREIDEVSGGTSLMISTIGKKLAPRLPQIFSDVVYSYTSGKDFYWSTATIGVSTKNRNLALGDKLPQDFGPVFQAYIARRARAEEA